MKKNIYSGIAELFNNENLKKYNFNIVRKTLRFIDNKKSRLVDFGAGIGTLSLFFRDFGINPVCVELDDFNINELVKRNFVPKKNLSGLSNIDIIFSSNVLEHIENDNLVLRQFNKIISNDGKLILYLPAFNCLWSDMDNKVGHFRRYTYKLLKNKFDKEGFSVIHYEYVDSLGFFASFLIKIFGFNSNRIGSVKSLVFYDKYLFPISKIMDLFFCKFFGKNIFIVAKKK